MTKIDQAVALAKKYSHNLIDHYIDEVSENIVEAPGTFCIDLDVLTVEELAFVIYHEATHAAILAFNH